MKGRQALRGCLGPWWDLDYHHMGYAIESECALWGVTDGPPLSPWPPESN